MFTYQKNETPNHVEEIKLQNCSCEHTEPRGQLPKGQRASNDERGRSEREGTHSFIICEKHPKGLSFVCGFLSARLHEALSELKNV